MRGSLDALLAKITEAQTAVRVAKSAEVSADLDDPRPVSKLAARAMDTRREADRLVLNIAPCSEAQPSRPGPHSFLAPKCSCNGAPGHAMQMDAAASHAQTWACSCGRRWRAWSNGTVDALN
jgi:hypothetical protein